jgi:chromosome segregation ATPase
MSTRTDPFDTVREAISVYHVASGKKEEAHAALASIEERIAELESELTDSEINFRDQLDRARAAEADYYFQMERAEDAEARIAELEAALREIAAMSSQVSPYEPHSRQHSSDVARRALEGEAALATSEQAEGEK